MSPRDEKRGSLIKQARLFLKQIRINTSIIIIWWEISGAASPELDGNFALGRLALLFSRSS